MNNQLASKEKTMSRGNQFDPEAALSLLQEARLMSNPQVRAQILETVTADALVDIAITLRKLTGTTTFSTTKENN